MKGEYKKNLVDFCENVCEEKIPNILVVGVGNSGNNTVSKLAETGILSVKKVAVNMDRDYLLSVNADIKILIGRSLTKGLGAGGCPEIGKKAVELARGTFEDLFKAVDLVFICAELKDKAGIDATAVMAEIAKYQGAIAIAVIRIPYSDTRNPQINDDGIEELVEKADSIILFDENVYPIQDDPEQIIAESIGKISSILVRQSLMNVDLRELESIICSQSFALIVVERSKISELPEKIAEQYDNLNRYGYKKFSGALIHITGGTDLSLQVAEELVENIRYTLGINNIACSADVEEKLEEEVTLMLILTGFNFDNAETEFFEANELLISKRIPFSIVEEWEEYLKTKFDYEIVKNIISMVLASPYIINGLSLKPEDVINDIELSVENVDFGTGNDSKIKKRMIEIAKENISEGFNKGSRLDYFV